MVSLSAFAGLRRGSLPFIYLGVPLFIGTPKRRWLQCIVDKILSNFDKWKGHTLSIAGHLALINSVIHGSFLHSFMVYKWPILMIRKLKKVV